MNMVNNNLISKIRVFFDTLSIDLKDKGICVCLSGGADSVALLLSLTTVSKYYGFNVYACHFNHMIRGYEADKDEEFCKSLCEKIGIKLYCGRDDVPAYARLNKISMEDAARQCRYAFFERIYSKNNIDFCATGHNMNDNAETLIFNLIRGSGINGASAIPPINGHIIRPFLNVKRDEIESFLSDLDQEFVTDSTNLSDDYTRNNIRHNIIPAMEKINPSLVDTLSRFIVSNRADRDYFENEIVDLLDSDLRNLHRALRSRVIFKKFNDFSGEFLNNALLCEIEKAILSDTRIVLPINNNTEAIVQNGNVCFYNKCDVDSLNYPEVTLNYGDNLIFSDKVIISISNTKDNESKKINKISTSDLISFDNIYGELRVRNRLIGDKICIRGVNRTLKKLFIEKKIPKEYRNIIPILCDDKGIIYVPFVGISDRVYTKNINGQNKYITTVLNTVNIERWYNAYEK